MKGDTSLQQRVETYPMDKILLVVGIIFLSLNLRASLTAVGPVVSLIRAETGMSNSLAGLLTTLPVLAFAIISPFIAKINQRMTSERIIFIGLVVMLIGVITRSTPWVTTIFVGTFLIGAGLTASNVLIPSIIKDRLPKQMGTMTGLYTTIMNIAAAISSGVSVTLAFRLGWSWEMTLLFWGALVLLAMLFWFPQLSASRINGSDNLGGSDGVKETAASADIGVVKRSVWRTGLAWYVSLFMGAQSMIFFGPLMWMTEIIMMHGFDRVLAGWMLTLMLATNPIGAFTTPIIANRLREQKWLGVGVGLLFFISLSGLLIGGPLIIVVFWSVLLGITQGAGIALSLTFFALRAETSQRSAQLSGMAQTVGYYMASLSPFMMGMLFDLTRSWSWSIVMLMAIALLVAGSGYKAGARKYV